MKVNKVMMQYLKALSSEDPRLFEKPLVVAVATVSSDYIVLQKVRH